jgi:hypothetical protein
MSITQKYILHIYHCRANGGFKHPPGRPAERIDPAFVGSKRLRILRLARLLKRIVSSRLSVNAAARRSNDATFDKMEVTIRARNREIGAAAL